MKNLLKLSVLITLLMKATAFSQNWNAVCVGINDYPGTTNDLNWCVNDATSMKEDLISYKQWSSSRITLLTDSYASETGIQTATTGMSTSTGNTNFFHYSGHGDSQELGGSNGLIPSNSLSARITQSELQSNLGSTYNQCTAFLDACGTGIFPRDMTRGVISSACEADEYAVENSSIQHGFFTYYLMAGLTQSSINTAEQLHGYAAPLTTQSNSSQHPQLGDHFSGYLAIYNSTYTTSGTLQRYETWSIPTTLQGNVTIPTGVTLTISSDATVNPNGYSITSSGGTLTVQSGATINGAVLLTGTTYNAIYPTMQAALSAATSGQTVGVNIAQTVASNFSVQSGVTLSLGSSATVTFGSAKKISVYGILNAAGTTFQGNGTAGNWNSLSFYSGSSGNIQNSTIRDAVCGIYTNSANVTISNNTITNNSLYGISSISNSTLNVSNCTISNNGTGITANSITSSITGNSILNNTNYGINATGISIYDEWYSNTFHGNGYAVVLNNASPWIAYNTICDNTHGVVINSSFPNFCDYAGGGYNAITYSTTPLFRADNSSTVVMGYWSQGGYNSVFGSDLPDMEARNSSGIWADNTYWGGQPSVLADGTSWITTRTPLASDPNPTSCSGSGAQSSFVINSSAIKANVSSTLDDKTAKYEQALANGRGGYFQKAKETLLTLIDGEYDHKYSPLALLAFYEFTLNEKYIKNKSGLTDTLNTDLNDLLAKVSKRVKGDSLSPYALRFLAREAALARDTRGMISYNKEIIANYPNSSNELSALYDLTTHYAEIEQDYTKADAYYSRMVTAYPKEDLTLFAGINLGGNQASLKQIMLADADQLPIAYDLSNAFPNPFNPITTITYQLPKEGLVTLKIYDILGNEVRTLVNEQKAMGKYTVQFDASSLASGMYVYQLRVNDYTSTKKMLLLK